MRAAVTLVLVLAGGLVATASAAAPGPPRRGVLVEGKTFGGLPLGLSAAQVRKRWGKKFGVCDNCSTLTWYYTFVPYAAQGIGVEFRLGRVDAYFTLGAPNWQTRKGLHVSDPTAAVARIYGNAPPIQCTGYQAIQIVTGSSLLLVYLNGNQVYGLSLARRDVSPCR